MVNNLCKRDNKMAIKYLFLVALASLTACAMRSPSESVDADVCRSNDAEVIELALMHEFDINSALKPDKILILYQEVSVPVFYGERRPKFPAPLLAELERKNKSGGEIGAIGDLGRVRYVISAERDEIFKGDEGVDVWSKFYSYFPNAGSLVNVSLPSFSRDNRSALVYLERKSGSLAAAGILKLVKCDRGKWQVSRWETVWVI